MVTKSFNGARVAVLQIFLFGAIVCAGGTTTVVARRKELAKSGEESTGYNEMAEGKNFSTVHSVGVEGSDAGRVQADGHNNEKESNEKSNYKNNHGGRNKFGDKNEDGGKHIHGHKGEDKNDYGASDNKLDTYFDWGMGLGIGGGIGFDNEKGDGNNLGHSRRHRGSSTYVDNSWKNDKGDDYLGGGTDDGGSAGGKWGDLSGHP